MKIKPSLSQPTGASGKPDGDSGSTESKQPFNTEKYQDQFEIAKQSTIDHFLAKPPSHSAPRSSTQKPPADSDPEARLELAGNCITFRPLEPVADCDPVIREAKTIPKK